MITKIQIDKGYGWLCRQKKTPICFAFVVVLSLIIFFFFVKAPINFPVNSVYTIPKGVGLNQVAIDLAQRQIIKSSFLFKSFSVLFGGSKAMIAGDYVLDKPSSAVTLAWRLTHGDFNLELERTMIVEGLNIFELAEKLAEDFPQVDPKNFIELAKSKEGYLFPDTYYFYPNVEASTIISVLSENFDKQIKPFLSAIAKTGRSLSDIVKMASIIEEEAATPADRRWVAGILWKRLEADMPLQVDASFRYINGKGTKDLTLTDLKIDSPYNSYLYRGLPPTPISNPGLDSLQASIEPTQSDFWYFLSDTNGQMHYAKTYNEHLKNKKVYLK